MGHPPTLATIMIETEKIKPGDFIPADDPEFRSELLFALESFHELCETHGLTYFLIGGSLIGAVRHGGFIPWDNDLDVAMPRLDYDRLVKLRDRMPSGVSLAVPDLDEWYNNTKVRIYSTRYKIKENFVNAYEFGPWVDVFPLDGVYGNATLRHLHFKLVKACKFLVACRIGGIKEGRGIRKTVKACIRFLSRPIPKTFFYKIYFKIVTLGRPDSVLVGNVMGRWGERECIAKQELSERELVSFSTLKVWTFRNYGEWLERVYGDYMTPPSEDDQVVDHPVIKL